MRSLFLVAGGGMLGALARYGVGLAASRWLGTGFPWGTLLVNLVGCFCIGLAGQHLANLEARGDVDPAVTAALQFWRQGFIVGFLGALTTFSAFGWDTLVRLERQPLLALANVAASVLLGLAAVWAGMVLAKG